MNQLTKEKRVQVLACLIEGNSIRSTVRLTGVAKNTVTKLLIDAGRACAQYQDENLRNLPCQRVQVDEIWSFCYAKEKNVPKKHRGEFGYGDVWTWVALCADTKIVPCWLVGGRDTGWASEFMADVAKRMASRVQLASDVHNAYLEAVEYAFGGEVDYAQLVKLYGKDEKADTKYSPPVCLAAKPNPVVGNPDRRHISTSYVERQNLTMRMSMRRFTRLTNALSKKVQNLQHAVALYFMNYNFCRIHKTLRITPAMAAKVTSRVWEISDIVDLIEKMKSN
jgi:IS1 family transposase